MKKARKATLKAEEAEICQPLKDKTSGKPQLYERMRVDDDDDDGAAEPKSPYRRLADASSNARTKKKSGDRETSFVMVSTRPRRGAVVNTTRSSPKAPGLSPSPPGTASPPHRSTLPSRPSRSTARRSPPSAPRRNDAPEGQRAVAPPAAKHDAPSRKPTASIGAAATTTTNMKTVGGEAPPTRTENAPKPIPPTRLVAHVQPKVHDDWLTMLIPDEGPGGPTGTAAAAAASTEDEMTTNRRVVDFSSDFSTMFDSHNDSDSITWDPNAEVMAAFPCPSAAHQVGEAPAADKVDQTLIRDIEDMIVGLEAHTTEGLHGSGGSEACNVPTTTIQEESPQAKRAPEDEGSSARLALRSKGPPMSTVLVCKVTATTTTATASHSTTSSSNSSTSTADSNPSQLVGEKEGRDDYDEDGVSDMETEGAEDSANVQERAAKRDGVSRIPPRPTQQLQPVQAPQPEPPRGEMQRRLSFSSLKMMLDKHSTSRNIEGGDNETLEDWFRDDDSLMNDEEIDPAIVRDGKEDTYSFIGADYSFGADRSLISLLP